ncbi:MULTISPECIES: SDR family oxidoreductase [unclassified Roseivivax]|uniref:SDR family oxidoreductase n=1 Tax=Roseivivax sp. GX 12232 TaxID=2900547 RepID=UPI001E4D35C3|nr:SDR family oxidoreductase [Roseivivax sp. GX 12232]MCE0503803.1 SDR family oxidoreductase [Roseivivax sp. GX 12232]
MTRILVTGSNRGIGSALCAEFTDRGAEVLATARGSGGQIGLDVTDPVSVRDVAARLEGEELDVLVCNAGIYPDKGEDLAEGYPREMWEDAFATNVFGVFQSVQAFLPALRRAKAGRVAIISSQMGSSERAPGGSYIYRASKAAAVNLGRNLAADLQEEGVAVGIYHPGWVRTDMGGETAEISVEDSARGLADRIDGLSLDTTGRFETWDGRLHPF